MKFKNKFLVAALAITMTIGPSLTKDFSNLSIRSNVAYASEENPDDKEGKFTEEELKSIVNDVSEYLVDNYEDLLSFEKVDEKLENKTFYEDNLKVLKKEPTIEDTDTEETKLTKAQTQIQDNLVAFISSKEDIKNKLEADKNKLEADTDKAIVEKINNILNTIEVLGVESAETDSGTKQLVVNETEENVKFYRGNIVTYIKDKYKANTETEEIKNILAELKSIVESDRYSKIDENPDFKLANENDVKKLKDQLNSVSELLKNNDATKDNLEKAREDLLSQLAKVSKQILSKKIESIEKIIKDNKDKIDDKKENSIKEYIETAKKDIDNPNYEQLNQYIYNINSHIKDLNKAIEGGQQEVDKLKDYKETIKEAESFKNSPDYYRSTPSKKLAFDEALNELKVYISKVEKKESEFNKENADNLVGKLGIAQTNLNGFKYKELLEEAKKKLDKNKNKLGDKYDALLKTYNELADENNKEYTVDRVRAFSDDIDAKLKSATLKPSTNNPSSKPSTSKPKTSGVQVSAKKVAVPRAQNGSRKSAKSLVRTGIDSIKIFGVVAVVAVVLLLLTRNKSKNEKNDNEK